jgi:hypothetical protein
MRATHGTAQRRVDFNDLESRIEPVWSCRAESGGPESERPEPPGEVWSAYLLTNAPRCPGSGAVRALTAGARVWAVAPRRNPSSRYIVGRGSLYNAGPGGEGSHHEREVNGFVSPLSR